VEAETCAQEQPPVEFEQTKDQYMLPRLDSASDTSSSGTFTQELRRSSCYFDGVSVNSEETKQEEMTLSNELRKMSTHFESMHDELLVTSSAKPVEPSRAGTIVQLMNSDHESISLVHCNDPLISHRLATGVKTN
jgi:hypothetical protein